MSTLQEAAGQLVPGGEVMEIDANLARVTTGDGEFALRQWEIPIPRVKVIGQALDWQASEVDGTVYTVRPWYPGRVLARYGNFRDADGEVIDVPMPPSAAALAVTMEATKAVARVHLASRENSGLLQLPSFTLRQLLHAKQTTWAEQRRVLGDHAGGTPEIRRWLRCGNRVMPATGERLQEATYAYQDRSVLLHGNLWPRHLLVSEGGERQLTGVLGWSSGLAGSPLVDLAHLAVHTMGWSAANAESLLGAYTEVAPLRPEERRLLPVVAALDLVDRVGHLLHLAFVDDRMIGHEAQPVFRSGLKTLLVSLETLTNVLVPDEKPSQRRFTKAPGPRTPARTKAGSDRSRPGSGRGRPKAS